MGTSRLERPRFEPVNAEGEGVNRGRLEGRGAGHDGAPRLLSQGQGKGLAALVSPEDHQ
jgi:hypothetical protein